MYCCGEPESCGQKQRICSAVNDSANHAQCVAVTTHPALVVCHGVCCRKARQHCWALQWSESVVSKALLHPANGCLALISYRCTPDRKGSAMHIHVPLCAAVTLGRSCLQRMGALPAKMTLAFMGSQSPGGCAMTLALSSSESKKGCQNCG